ncbi:MAG: PilZ domain-containing protein [Candidatus Hydrogenedentes bacterium]|nr:PilZ domain-containing protein [Candidatus Hydrogenedentota bacterium]
MLPRILVQGRWIAQLPGMGGMYGGVSDDYCAEGANVVLRFPQTRATVCGTEMTSASLGKEGYAMPNELTQYLRVGQRALIHFGAGAPEEWRSSTTIRGWVAGISLLLDTPVLDGIRVSLERGGACTTRLLVEGMAIGFNSVVADANRNQSIFRVTWPADVEYVAIRKFERMKLRAPGVLHTTDGEKFDVEVRDVSIGGCRLFTTQSINTGSEVGISLQLFGGSALGPIPSVVRNEAATGKGVLVGCQFTNLDSVSRLEIECYLGTRPDVIRAGATSTPRAVIISRDLAFIESVRGLLDAAECEVVAAPSAVDGFHALRAAPTQVALAQCDLPDMTGVDICHVTHLAHGLEKLPIILFGGMPEDEAAANAAGAWRFFPSGTQPNMIARAIQEKLAPAVSP